MGVAVTLSEGVGKGVNFETLGRQIVEKLKAGYRGEKLANEIHTMIEKRYKAKMEAQEKKIGKPVGRKKPKPAKEKQKLKIPKKEKKPQKENIKKPGKGRKGTSEGGRPGGKGRGGRGKPR